MKLYIYCAGGFGKEVMDVARRKNTVTQEWSDIRFVDDAISAKESYGAVVMQFDQIVATGELNSSRFLIANGEPAVKRKIFKKLTDAGAEMATLVDVSCLVADSAIIESGVVVTPLCSVSSNAKLMANACVNTMTIIGHDVQIGKNSVISSMVNMGGACVVGDDSYIGMGALIKEGVRIGTGSIVGMGSVVYNDVPDGVIVVGNPARVSRLNENQRVFK